MHYVTKAELPILAASTAHEAVRMLALLRGSNKPLPSEWNTLAREQQDEAIERVKRLQADPEFGDAVDSDEELLFNTMARHILAKVK